MLKFDDQLFRKKEKTYGNLEPGIITIFHINWAGRGTFFLITAK